MIQTLKRLLGIRRSLPYEWIVSWIKRRCADTVQSGPFAGMKSRDGHVGCKYCPRILGIYEMELHSVLQRILGREFERVVDVGAAEGYYALGFAQYPNIRHVVAFETDPAGQELIRQLALENGTQDKVEVRGCAGVAEFTAALDTGMTSLVIMDIEGGEGTLLDPGRIPALARAHVLVELHDQLVPGVSPTLHERFEATHQIETITSRPRRLDDLPLRVPWLFRGPLRKWLLMATEDGRGVEMQWFWMTPR